MVSGRSAVSPAGRFAPTIGGAHGFVPNPLPPRIVLEPLIGPIADASRRLGELAGMGARMANPYLTIAPFQRREAVASSRIEGTRASLSDVFSLEAGARASGHPSDAREVQNYVTALQHALARLASLPLSLRLIRELHAKLFSGGAGDADAALPIGEFRRVQNWIGGASVAAARYVPTPVPDLGRALDAFEKYLHAKSRLPVIVDAALIHYQFEAIHPFADGNGRVGRLLIPLYLVARGALKAPLLYLSPFFDRNRDEYYERLLQVSRRGDWTGWIEFFIRGVAEQSVDTIARMGRLDQLRGRYDALAFRNRASALTLRLIEHLFAAPHVTMPSVRSLLSITHRAAFQQIRRLVAWKILSPVGASSRPRVYVARAILEIVQDERVARE